jgi:hypothetical protein
LARAIPLFPSSIAVPVLLAFMRNFLFLLVHNEREKEREKGSKMFVHLNFLVKSLFSFYKTLNDTFLDWGARTTTCPISISYSIAFSRRDGNTKAFTVPREC